MMVQGGKKPFVSAECNYSCNKAGALRVHMQTHSGEKPYSCKQREYSCTTVSDLKKHLLTHSGEKTILLQFMPLFLHNKWSPPTAHDNTFRGEAFQL